MAFFTFVKILNSNDSVIPQTPILKSCQFGDSGGYVTIIFTSSTNQANIVSNSWKCSILFDFVGSNYTTCTWLDSSTVQGEFGVVQNGINYLSVDDIVTLKNNLITARCVTNTNCDLYTYSNNQSISALAPDDPITPTAVLFIPNKQNNCDDLDIDATQSTGNGGRLWTSIIWNVVKENGEIATTILNILNNNNGLLLSTTIIGSFEQYFQTKAKALIQGGVSSITNNYLYK
jgi:hypothetical protein